MMMVLSKCDIRCLLFETQGGFSWKRKRQQQRLVSLDFPLPIKKQLELVVSSQGSCDLLIQNTASFFSFAASPLLFVPPPLTKGNSSTLYTSPNNSCQKICRTKKPLKNSHSHCEIQIVGGLDSIGLGWIVRKCFSLGVISNRHFKYFWKSGKPIAFL